MEPTDINNNPQPNVPIEPQPVAPINLQLDSPIIPEPHPHFKPILILIILGVLVVGFFASAKYAFHTWPFQISVVTTPPPAGGLTPTPSPSPTLDETANWQTYRNDEYGFEFKYPGNCGIVSTDDSTGNLNYKTIAVVVVHTGDFCNFNVTVAKNVIFEDWIRVMEPKSAAGSSLVTKSSDINFLNANAKDWKVFLFDHEDRNIVFVKNNIGYVLNLESEDPNIPNFESLKIISDQILSTFKFVE